MSRLRKHDSYSFLFSLNDKTQFMELDEYFGHFIQLEYSSQNRNVPILLIFFIFSILYVFCCCNYYSELSIKCRAELGFVASVGGSCIKKCEKRKLTKALCFALLDL